MEFPRKMRRRIAVAWNKLISQNFNYERRNKDDLSKQRSFKHVEIRKVRFLSLSPGF